ncbi:MAG TPA: c-type cytochrome [Gammaproteobacteria bacterium]|nr:c-type cytochrome [Gammaproteobacteria bacterium]
MRSLLAIVVVFALPQATAQHATAFDIENGARAYQGSCAACHGPDGNLIAGIDFGRGVFRRSYTDDELARIIVGGIPNTPMPPSPATSEPQALQIVAYLRSLPETATDAGVGGDAARGREIVRSSSDCMTCHRIGGTGSALGPDLSRIGLDRRAAELVRALVDPNAEVQPNQRTYRVTPRRGEPVVGRLLNHDTFTVQLFDTQGQLRSFDKADLRDFGIVASPMPSYRDKLSSQALADVVSYLVTLRGGPVP